MNERPNFLRLGRVSFVLAHDLFMAALAFELAVWARYQTYGAPQDFFFLWQGTLLFTVVCGFVFWWGGLYRGTWHYASFTDLIAIARSVTVAILVFLALLFLLTRLQDLPRSALVFSWPLLIVLLGGPRLFYRLIKDGNLNAVFERDDDARVPVLLLGAGDAAEMFIREMTRNKVSGYRVVGIVDDKPGRIGRDIRGVRIWGTIAQIPEVVERLAASGRRPQRLIVTNDRLDAARLRSVLHVAMGIGMTLARLPRLTDFQKDRSGAKVAFHGAGLEIRPVDMEDLLGRPQRVLDRDAMRALIASRRVMVTGAGGTIGSELARQIAALGPARLTLLDNAEYNLYLVDLEMSERHADIPRAALLGDVRDEARLESVFAEERPELVFHAAAFKHVPLAEANPAEAVLTNVIGTRNVVRACRRHGAATMVLISTDKAVNPAGVMGATKRLAESYCQALARSSERGAGTHLATVRFGNVLGSTGSVVPLFQHQIASGGPVTVTHPDVTRYFMTTREAVELVLQASALPPEDTQGGKIFVLDMGEPVRIQDLARQMIGLASLEAGRDIAITYTGLRPGEKLNEEVLHEAEELAPTRSDGIVLASPRAMEFDLLEPQIDRLEEVARAGNAAEALRLLHTLVPEYEADADAVTAAHSAAGE
jgi:O-antigen biosynthesis protein WbqV